MNETTKDSAKKVGGIILKIVILAVIIALLAFCFRQYNAERTEKTDNPAMMQGNVKLTEIDLNSMLEGKIDTVYVKEGDSVKAGDIVLTIEPDVVKAKVSQAEATVSQAQAALAQAKATQSAAEAVLSKAQNGAREEDIEQAKAAFEYAEKSYERMNSLYDSGAISASDLDSVKAQYLSAKAVYEEAVNGSRTEDVAAAAAQVEEAKAAVKQYQAAIEQAQAAVGEANAYLDESVITAPSDGVITALNVEKGELISTGMALATMRTSQDAWIEVNVRETSLGLVSEGQKVELTFPAYEGKSFSGTVATVSQNPDFATKKATNENGSFDVLSYKVKINMNDMTENVYAGMTVMVNFDADNSDEGDEQ